MNTNIIQLPLQPVKSTTIQFTKNLAWYVRKIKKEGKEKRSFRLPPLSDETKNFVKDHQSFMEKGWEGSKTLEAVGKRPQWPSPQED